ncbi:MAG: hypothetical protein K0Q72_3368, partial [Armatimonadetes bacterium]|nr:hypothetical protein [Armatimonadota bacterium]
MQVGSHSPTSRIRLASWASAGVAALATVALAAAPGKPVKRHSPLRPAAA